MNQSDFPMQHMHQQEVLPCYIHVDVFYSLSGGRHSGREIQDSDSSAAPTMLTKFETKSARVKGKITLYQSSQLVLFI